MSSAVLPEARTPSSGWARFEWTRTPAQSLGTALNAVDELFLLLRHIAEVPDEGVRVAKLHTPNVSDTDAAARHKKARAFLRQAENLYRAGQRTPYRTSALLYYYAFMNLAKAALELRGLSYDRHHGLTRDEPKTDDLNKLVVDIRPRGVFPTLYECEFGVPWPKDLRPTIARLLSYATDIGFQYQRTGLGTGVWSIAPCKLRSIANEQTHECWLEIALRREFNVSAAPSTFSRRFEEVRLSNALARTRYEIPAEAMRSFRFFQTAVLPFPGQVPVADLRALVDDALGSMMEPLYVGEELDMMLACPYMDGTLSTPMNEVVAIYLVMFYLGSLVRYLPDYLDDLLGTRNAYVLESFVTSVPHTALRALVARAAGEFFLFNR